MNSLESLEGIDHLALTYIRSTSRVSSKLTTTRIRHDDERTEDTEEDFEENSDAEIDKSIGRRIIASHSHRDDLCKSSREENNKRIDHALEERHSHHIPIHDMSHLMSNDSFDFISIHLSDETT